MAFVRRAAWPSFLVFAAALAACASGGRAPKTDPCCEERAILKAAAESLAINDFKSADGQLAKVLASPRFDALDEDSRHQALLLGGVAALQLNDCARAHRLLVRACGLAGANGADWMYRLAAASADGDPDDALASLARLARSWPAALPQVGDETIMSLVAEARPRQASGDRRLQALEALFDAGWKLRGGFEPSGAWQDLSLLLLEKGRASAARAAAERVTEPYALIGMRADKRFDPVTPPSPARERVSAAAAREIDGLWAVARSQPRSLDALVQLSFALVKARRHREALAVCDDAIARAASVSRGGAKLPFDDMGALDWIMDHRAQALMGLGRWEEAVAALKRGAGRPENGDVNVSQRLNLAGVLLALGRPREALGAVADLGAMSPYGRMQVEAVRHGAGLQLKDRAMVAAAMSYMSAHEADAPLTYADELVRERRLEDAAGRVIARLADPYQRTQALVEFQTYAEVPEPPLARRQGKRWRAVFSRADVRAAVEKVGRLERYDLEPLP